MLISFIVTVIFTAALLYLPGYLTLRGLGFHRSFSVGIAPSAAVMAIGVLGMIYSAIGIKSSPVNLFLLPLAVGVCIFVLGYWRKSSTASVHVESESVSIFALVIVIAIGSLLGMLFFVRRLPSVDAIFQQWDYPHHLNGIKAFVDSGNLSPIHGTSYAAGQAVSSFDETSSFYPSGWAMVCAIASMGCNVSVPLSINAVDFAFAFIVFPVSMEALLVRLIPGKRTLPVIATVACMSLAVFPWGVLTFGPIFPNLAGFAVLPGMICAFIDSVDDRKAGMLLIWIAACLGVFFLHPNIIFSIGLYIAPFIIHTIRSRNISLHLGRYCMGKNGVTIIFAVLCIALWTLAYNFPPLAPTVMVSWRNYASLSQAIVDLITLSYVNGFPPSTAVQLVPALILIVGFVSIWRDRDYSERWMLCPFIISAIFMVVVESFPGDSPIKHFLTSFWYTDPYRIAAMTTIFSIPILVRGIYCCIEKTDDFCSVKLGNRIHYRNTAVVVIVYFCLVFYPSFQVAGLGKVNMAFSDVRDNIQIMYGYGKPLTEEEHEFLTKVKEIVGDDLVINNPYDGSMMAYGTDGINCYYRYFIGYGTSSETAESAEIRQKLDLINTDNEVRDAVHSIGAKYVLILDNSDAEHSFAASAYNKSQWAGIENINDDTSGLTVVLEEGNLRLYKIDDAA